jgi:hypothetical protein
MEELRVKRFALIGMAGLVAIFWATRASSPASPPPPIIGTDDLGPRSEAKRTPPLKPIADPPPEHQHNRQVDAYLPYGSPQPGVFRVPGGTILSGGRNSCSFLPLNKKKNPRAATEKRPGVLLFASRQGKTNMRDNIKFSSSFPENQALLRRFYAVKHRCGRGTYHHIRFGFESAREAAGYMLATCGPLLPGMTIDRVDGRRGYEPGNLRYATVTEQLANRRFKTRNHPFTGASPCH